MRGRMRLWPRGCEIAVGGGHVGWWVLQGWWKVATIREGLCVAAWVGVG